MDWFINLFMGKGIASAVIILALTIAIGLLLNRIKFGSVSLGVTWVLFAGIVLSHFGLTIDTLDEKYNCEACRNHFSLKNAVLIHAVGHRKFWKYYYFDRWFRFYKEWVRETGIKCQNHFSICQKLSLLKYPLFQVAPNPAEHPIKFITYLLRFLLRANA